VHVAAAKGSHPTTFAVYGEGGTPEWGHGGDRWTRNIRVASGSKLDLPKSNVPI